MKNLSTAGLLLALVWLIAGCKNGNEPIPDKPKPQKAPSKYLLRSTNWKTFGATAIYHYNPDSTLKQVQPLGLGQVTDFTYENKRVTEVIAASSLYKWLYTYNAAGQVTQVTKVPRQSTIGATLKFEYRYNANGTVAEMKYYQLNEAGSKLIYTNTYSYSAGPELNKITSVANTGFKLVQEIQSYSDKFDFNPLIFINTELSEQYQLYNLPVLQQLEKLPRKIVVTAEKPGEAPYIEKIYETDFTINQLKIEKMVNKIQFPANPTYNTSSEVMFSYE